MMELQANARLQLFFRLSGYNFTRL